MRILHLSDLHLGNHNYTFSQKFQETFSFVLSEFLSGRIEENVDKDLLVISGDVFEYPWVNNKTISDFYNEIQKHQDELRVIVSSGNHDMSSVRRPTSLELLENITNKTESNFCKKIIDRNIDLYRYESINDLPLLFVSTERITRVILNEQNIIIDSIPYNCNGSKMTFSRKQSEVNKELKDFKKILLCHGSIDGLDVLFDNRDKILSSSIIGYDFVLKGHIHKTYNIEENNVYSSGSLNKVEGSDECGYNIINEEFKLEQKTIPEDILINYKVFQEENENTINDTLSSLTKNDIVLVYYSGRPEIIDQELYYKCFHNCVKFSFVFNDSSIIRGSEMTSTEGGAFKTFDHYMNDYFKSSENLGEIEKLYNDIKSNFNS